MVDGDDLKEDVCQKCDHRLVLSIFSPTLLREDYKRSGSFIGNERKERPRIARFLFVQTLKLKGKENWKLRLDALLVYGISITFSKTAVTFFHSLTLSSCELTMACTL